MHSDESSSESKQDDMGDFIVEDDDDTGRTALRDGGVLVDTDTTLNSAFELLRQGKVNEFLTTEVIQKTFAPATQLLSTFGYGTAMLRQFWREKWNGMVSESTIKVRKTLCEACGRQRMIGYKLSMFKNGDRTDMLIGTDCFEVKVSPLFDFVTFCVENAHNSIEDISEELYERLAVISEAPAKMVRLYSEY
jgi:hypothetical protein